MFKQNRTKPVFILLFLFITSNTWAQGQEVETMVVTASRTPVSSNYIGSSYTVIENEDLLQRQVAPLSEILREVPGFSVSRNGVLGSTTQVRVRGAEANQVMVLIDGIEANDLSQSGEYNFANLLTTEVDHIEVIRGPQSALWGSDAVSGVINVITKRGEGPLSISGFAEGGSFGTWRGGGGISGSGERYHFNFNGSVIDTDGNNVSRQGNEDDGYKNETLSFSMGYKPLSNLDFFITGRHTDATSEFDPTDFVTTGLPMDGDRQTDVSQDYGRIQSKLSLLDGRWEHLLGAAITSTDNDNFADGAVTGSNGGKKYKFDYQTNYFLNTTGPSNASHTFTFAIDHEIEEFVQRGPISAFGDDPNQDLDIESTGVVGEYRITLAEVFALSASVRHDDNSDFDDATTYRVTTAYHVPQSGSRLHASYGTGIKNPTFTERFGFFSASLFFPFRGNPDLKPEQSEGWEIGFDQSFLDDRLLLGITYYNEELTDEINGFVFDPVSFVTTAENVNGKSKREGIEFTARLNLVDNFKISSTYSHTDATEADVTGNQIEEIRRPKHIANINLNYDFLDERANINLNVNYNGKQEDNFFPPFPQPQQRVTLDSFTLMTLTGNYQVNENFSVYGRIENLLNENYEEVFGFQGQGRGAYFGVKANLQP